MRFPILILALANIAFANDWPTYRHDNRRSGVTKQSLTLPLNKIWTHHGQEPQQAWTGPAKWDSYSANDGLQSMRNFDPCYFTTAIDNLVYYGSSADDAIHCLDAKTGKEKWVSFTGSAVRFPPTIFKGKAWYGSDDGFVYCSDAKTGKLLWKKRVAPSPRLILSNGKLISPWPVRTGVTVENDRAWFAASLVPWKKSYLWCLDALSGEQVYLREHEGFTLQGAILAGGEKLYVPQGRAAPLAFHQKDGNSAGSLSHAGGVYCLLTKDHQLIAGPPNQREKDEQMRLHDPSTGKRLATFNHTSRVVVDGDYAYLHSLDKLKRLHFSKRNSLETKIADLDNKHKESIGAIKAIEKKIAAAKKADHSTDISPLEKELQPHRESVKTTDQKIKTAQAELPSCWLWEQTHPAPLELIVAGDQLVAGFDGLIIIFDTESGKPLWKTDIPGKVHGLTVAHGRLIASTDRGAVHTFAP